MRTEIEIDAELLEKVQRQLGTSSWDETFHVVLEKMAAIILAGAPDQEESLQEERTSGSDHRVLLRRQAAKYVLRELDELII
jgi:Arc/MetJ family transcription regulator